MHQKFTGTTYQELYRKNVLNHSTAATTLLSVMLVTVSPQSHTHDQTIESTKKNEKNLQIWDKHNEVVLHATTRD